MEKHQYGFATVILAFGLASFALCIAAEFKRSKEEDLRLDGKLCHLPQSRAYGLGVAALTFLCVVQAAGNIIICQRLCTKERSTKYKHKMLPMTFYLFSWISFVIAVILISVATSMNSKQALGDGWLDRECYIVRDGVYITAGVLCLATMLSILASTILTTRRNQIETGYKVYAQS